MGGWVVWCGVGVEWMVGWVWWVGTGWVGGVGLVGTGGAVGGVDWEGRGDRPIFALDWSMIC